MPQPNALDQVTFEFDRTRLAGFSMAALATYLQLPDYDSCFDMGECPLSAVPLNHVFLTHAHGDHTRCLMRHWHLRRVMSIARPPVYYLPEAIRQGCEAWIRTEFRFEGKREPYELPRLIGVAPGDGPWPLPYRKDLRAVAFASQHNVPGCGYTIFEARHKLLDEFVGRPGKEIAELRRKGVEVQRDLLHPVVSFVGDSVGSVLRDEAHIWRSRIVVIETTHVLPEERAESRARAHTHLDELVELMEEDPDLIACDHLVLTHFSMMYPPELVHETVAQRIPERFRDRVHVLL